MLRVHSSGGVKVMTFNLLWSSLYARRHRLRLPRLHSGRVRARAVFCFVMSGHRAPSSRSGDRRSVSDEVRAPEDMWGHVRPAWPGQLLLVSGVVTRLSLWRFSSVQCGDNECRLHAQICDITLKTDVNWSSISCLFILKIIKASLPTRSYWRDFVPSDLSAYDPSQLGGQWEDSLHLKKMHLKFFLNVSGCFCKVVWRLKSLDFV